jgi:hypothetical protein
MKKRSGFVSNSSSTSFTCCISEQTLVGHDGEYDENTAECLTCRSEYMCKYVDVEALSSLSETELTELVENNDLDCAIPLSVNDVQLKFSDKNKNHGYYGTGHRYVVSKMCPICSLKEVKTNDLINYLLIKMKYVSRKQAVKEIRTVFQDYDKLKNMINIIGIK